MKLFLIQEIWRYQNWDPLVLLGATSIITEPSSSTVLPVQPAIIWDPVLFPKGPVWLLNNVTQAFGCGDEYIYGLIPFPPG